MNFCQRPHPADPQTVCAQPIPCPHHPQQRRPVSFVIERRAPDDDRYALDNMGRILARTGGP